MTVRRHLNGGRNYVVCWRRAFSGCDNEGLWTPVILIPIPPEQGKKLVRGRLVLDKCPTCDEHKAALRINNFFGAHGWRSLKASIIAAGRTPPKEEDLTLEWTRNV